MNLLAWYKSKMNDPTLSTTEYLQCWNIVRDMEFRQAVINFEAEERFKQQQIKQQLNQQQ